jgi:hypothetical protein
MGLVYRCLCCLQAGDKGLPLPGRQDLENRIYIDRSPQSQGGKSQRERAQRYYRTFTGFSEFSTGDKAFHNVLPLEGCWNGHRSHLNTQDGGVISAGQLQGLFPRNLNLTNGDSRGGREPYRCSIHERCPESAAGGWGDGAGLIPLVPATTAILHNCPTPMEPNCSTENSTSPVKFKYSPIEQVTYPHDGFQFPTPDTPADCASRRL